MDLTVNFVKKRKPENDMHLQESSSKKPRHSTPAEIHECTFCDLKFRTAYNLRQHCQGRTHLTKLHDLSISPNDLPHNLQAPSRPTKTQKQLEIRSFYMNQEKCVCGGFLPETNVHEAVELPNFSKHDPDAKRKMSNFKKRHHSDAQLQKILDHPRNSSWLRYCPACRQVYCQPCRAHMNLATCLELTRGGYRFVLGVADGMKWEKLLRTTPDPHNNLKAHAECVEMHRLADVWASEVVAGLTTASTDDEGDTHSSAGITASESDARSVSKPMKLEERSQSPTPTGDQCSVLFFLYMHCLLSIFVHTSVVNYPMTQRTRQESGLTTTATPHQRATYGRCQNIPIGRQLSRCRNR